MKKYVFSMLLISCAAAFGMTEKEKRLLTTEALAHELFMNQMQADANANGGDGLHQRKSTASGDTSDGGGSASNAGAQDQGGNTLLRQNLERYRQERAALDTNDSAAVAAFDEKWHRNTQNLATGCSPQSASSFAGGEDASSNQSTTRHFIAYENNDQAPEWAQRFRALPKLKQYMLLFVGGSVCAYGLGYCVGRCLDWVLRSMLHST